MYIKQVQTFMLSFVYNPTFSTYERLEHIFYTYTSLNKKHVTLSYAIITPY